MRAQFRAGQNRVKPLLFNILLFNKTSIDRTYPIDIITFSTGIWAETGHAEAKCLENRQRIVTLGAPPSRGLGIVNAPIFSNLCLVHAYGFQGNSSRCFDAVCCPDVLVS